jgi:Kef-type K+ transport system membrane component KefB
MTPRGEMGLIVASLGLTSGLISTGTYSVAVMAVILTTFIAIPILKMVLTSKKDKHFGNVEEKKAEVSVDKNTDANLDSKQ